jgi:hypothetical protein
MKQETPYSVIANSPNGETWRFRLGKWKAYRDEERRRAPQAHLLAFRAQAIKVSELTLITVETETSRHAGLRIDFN